MDILKKFEEYLKENYSDEENDNTVMAYISDIKQFLNFFEEHFGETIESFSRGHVIEYKKHLIDDRGLKFSSINRKLASLSIYENFLVDSNIRKDDTKVIRKKDFMKIDRPYITADMLPNKTIKKVRLKAGELSKRDYAIFVLFDEGGLRVSELVNLQLNRDIDFNMYQIHIFGKGNKIRTIFMNETIAEAINDYIPEREKMLNGRDNKYLFVSNKTANTNKPICRTSINNLLASYCNKTNEAKINPHVFRHNCATNMYQEGYSDLMIKKWLGHSSNATDIYTHPGGEKYNKVKGSI